jgi:hypothetical protein
MKRHCMALKQVFIDQALQESPIQSLRKSKWAGRPGKTFEQLRDRGGAGSSNAFVQKQFF